MPITSPNPMFDHLLKPFHGDNSNKWSNIDLGEEITRVVLLAIYFTHLIEDSGLSDKMVNGIGRSTCRSKSGAFGVAICLRCYSYYFL